MSPETRERLAALLDPGLEPVNPLDAWGTGRDYERVFTECLCTLMEDADTACGFISHSLRAGFWISEVWGPGGARECPAQRQADRRGFELSLGAGRRHR